MSNIYTDLAMEARELAGETSNVSQSEEKLENMTITRVSVLNETGAKEIGKPMGEYISIEADKLKERDIALFTAIGKQISKELEALLDKFADKRAPILIIGLGNRDVTPDSLGPKVVEHTFVTRHITEYLPQLVDERVRPVCAIAPGVLGVTGIETLEVIRGVVDKVKPAAVIAIDALASRKTERLCATVQLCDTGISPGAGVGNMRKGINKETLGVPVIAIGVPLVVYASTISQDAIELLAQQTGLHSDEGKLVEMVQKVMDEKLGPLVVTPKEIDVMVSDMSKLLADGINLALHALAYDEVKALLT